MRHKYAVAYFPQYKVIIPVFDQISVRVYLMSANE